MGATELAEQIAKILPLGQLYGDLLSPGMKQLGYGFEDVIKCIRLATFPIQVGSASQTQLENFLRAAVERVPESKRVLPAPQILGPVIEAVRYEPSDSEIEKMLAELLSRSMDSDNLGDAHPALPLLIRQLSTDEAVIIKLIAGRRLHQVPFQRVVSYRFRDGRSYLDSTETDEFPTSALMYPKRLNFYTDHLWSLGLAGVFETEQKPIFHKQTQMGSRQFLEYRLTDLGDLLANASFPRGPAS